MTNKTKHHGKNIFVEIVRQKVLECHKKIV